MTEKGGDIRGDRKKKQRGGYSANLGGRSKVVKRGRRGSASRGEVRGRGEAVRRWGFRGSFSSFSQARGGKGFSPGRVVSSGKRRARKGGQRKGLVIPPGRVKSQ